MRESAHHFMQVLVIPPAILHKVIYRFPYDLPPYQLPNVVDITCARFNTCITLNNQFGGLIIVGQTRCLLRFYSC